MLCCDPCSVRCDGQPQHVAAWYGFYSPGEYCYFPRFVDKRFNGDCNVSQYHKLSFIHTYRKLRAGLHTSMWADNDNPSGLPTSEEYQKALQCYLSLYTFDNTSEPFYYRVLTGQYGKRSHKAYHAIATYLERKGCYVT